MARPIEPTPTLNYEDSVKFLEWLNSGRGNDNEFYSDAVEGVQGALEFIEGLKDNNEKRKSESQNGYLEDFMKFKTVPGYEGYTISDTGLLFGEDHTLLTPAVIRDVEYISIYPTEPGKSKRFSIGQIVAMSFIGDIEGKTVINIDGNTRNNRVSNLKIIGEDDV
jgi:hypothetical protein